MILFLIFTLELLLGPDHDLKTCYAILHFKTFKSHNFSYIKTHTILFFLKHLRPKSVDRGDGPGIDIAALCITMSVASKCWVRCRYCLAGITKLGERVAKNTKLK